MISTTHLTELVDRYIDHRNQERPIGRELAPKTRSNYLECVQCYAVYLGRQPTIDDLKPEAVNVFLAALLAKGLSPYTVKNRRTGLRALMRYAKREGVLNADVDRLRRVHCPPLQVKGFGPAAMMRLLTAVATLRGIVRRTGVSKRIYFTSMLLTMWNIGCRVGDIPEIESSKFEPGGRLWVHEHKTRKSGWHQLHATTREAITACLENAPDRKLIWPAHRNGRALSIALSELIAAAGMSGTSRYIRRGASSELDKAQPGQGWRFLNHSSPRVFEQHYRDAEICGDESLSPPELPVTDEMRRLCKPLKKFKAVKQPADEPPVPVYARGADVPLTDEVREALRQHPLDDRHLAVLVGHLAAYGIPQRRLAEWWGVAFKRYQDYRYGYRTITLQAADRLRRAFDLPQQGVCDEGEIPLGSLTATPEIATLLNAKQFGAVELSSVCDYAKRQMGIRKWRLANNLGQSSQTLMAMCKGRNPVQPYVQLKLRELFEINQHGDAA